MRTYDIELRGVQSVNDTFDGEDIARLLPVLLKQHDLHVNSIKVTERGH